jgi:hypothetical protein
MELCPIICWASLLIGATGIVPLGNSFHPVARTMGMISGSASGILKLCFKELGNEGNEYGYAAL